MFGDNFEILWHEIMAEDNFLYMFGEHFEIKRHEMDKNDNFSTMVRFYF